MVAFLISGATSQHAKSTKCSIKYNNTVYLKEITYYEMIKFQFLVRCILNKMGLTTNLSNLTFAFSSFSLSNYEHSPTKQYKDVETKDL